MLVCVLFTNGSNLVCLPIDPADAVSVRWQFGDGAKFLHTQIKEEECDYLLPD